MINKIKLKPRDYEEENSPLAGFVDGDHYWIYVKQKQGSQKVETILRKGSIGHLKSILPTGTPIYDVAKVSCLVLMNHRPREIDRRDGRCSFPEFQQAIENNGAIRLW